MDLFPNFPTMQLAVLLADAFQIGLGAPQNSYNVDGIIGHAKSL